MAEQMQMRTTTQARPPFSNGTADTLTPKDIVNTLRRHVWLIIILTIAGFFAGGVTWFLLRKYNPNYTATTLIKVLSPAKKDPMKIEGGLVNEKRQYGYRLSIAQLIKQQGNLQELILRDNIRQTKWFKKFGNIQEKRVREAIKNLRKKMGAYADRDSDFVRLSMTCGSSEEAALIVNEMVRMFIVSYGSSEKKGITDQLEELEKQRNRLQSDVLSANKALDEVRERYEVTNLERVGSVRDIIEERLIDLNEERDDISLSIQQLQISIRILEEQAHGLISEQVERQLEVDPIMVELASRLAIREAVLAGLLTKFGENHKIVRQSREVIEGIKSERNARKTVIAQQVRQGNLQDAQDAQIMFMSQLERLEDMYKAADSKKKQLDLARIEYEKRVIVKDEREERLNDTKKQIEKLRVMHDDPEAAKIVSVGLAPAPLKMSSPRWEVFFPAGIVLGIMLGIGLAFLKEILNDLIRMPKDVAKYLRIPLLGVIPDADEDQQADNVDLYHVLRQAPYSFVSESYRRLRTNLKLSEAASSSKVLLISSCDAGDGKTTVAVNLATSLVAENRKVLLIDANFWKPSLGKLFPKAESTEQQNQTEQNQFGLSTLLAELCGYHQIIRSTDLQGLDIIDAGPLPSNPAELLASGQMELLVKHQQGNYDYIIVDGPPVLLVSEAKILAKAVHSTIMVFNAAATRRGVALRALRELREVDAKVVGAVLFAVRAMKGGYFREQFKSYQKYQQIQLAKSV